MKKILLLLLCFFNIFSFPKAYNKSVVDITKMDIYEIQDAIDKGYLTYELLIKLYLDRIEAYDNEFNTIITINDKAIETAKELDEIYKKNGRNSILFGIPILVKDNIDVEGMPTTDGTKSLKDNYPKDDAEIIKYLKDNNAIIIAKTNMSEFAFQAASSESSYGITKNAYNKYFSSYGSSGGTAVAVSLQFGLLGIGTDTNASLRLPAAANNVIGFRPTFDNLSNNGIINYDITRDTVGPITKTVKENGILMAVMEGKKEDTYIKNISNSEKIKIGIIDDFVEDSYTETENLMKNTINLLEKNNIEVVHIKNFYKKKYEKVNTETLGGWTMCYSFNNYIKDSTSKIKNFYDLTVDKGHIYRLWSYLTDCNLDISIIEDYDSIKEDYNNYVTNIYKKYDVDFLVFLSSKNRVLKVDETVDNLSIPGSSIASVLGYPAATISIGKDADGLYYGMEIVGLKNEEEKLYKFLYQYEKTNSKYELSSLAKPLYEVSDTVKELVNLYEKNYSNKLVLNFYNNKYFKEYKQVHKLVEEFIINYNNLEDKEIEEQSQKLLDRYETVTNNVNSSINIAISVILIPILLIIVLIIIFTKRKKKELNKKQ